MFPCVVWAGITNLIAGATAVLIPVYLVLVLDAPALVVGLVVGAEGVGALLGSAVATRMSKRIGPARVLLVASVMSPLALVLLPLSGSRALILLFAAGSALVAVGVVVGSIVTRTHRQTDTPDDLLPMVMATVRFFTWGALPIGAVGAGALASSALGVRGALWVTCAMYVLAPLTLLLSPVRSRCELSDADESIDV